MRNTQRYAAVLAVAAMAAVACSDSNTTEPIPSGASDITLDITTSRTLYAETTYTIKGYIHVTNGATLTIMPGTKIVGDYNIVGSSLFIMRGARIMAEGTADAPIVFTSQQAVGSRQPGDWGGLVLVGNGIDNRAGTIEIEGSGAQGVVGTPSGQNYKVIYTGEAGAVPSNVDNSGVLKYVRVEFAGYALTPGNEINSFSFGAVGNLTKLSYLQAVAGLDDAYEFWGGAVDGDHLVAYEVGDDSYDMSEGYSGRLQYLIAYTSTVLNQRSGAGTPALDPQGIENDGCNGTGCTSGFNSAPFTIPVVANFTIVGTNSTATSGTTGGMGMMIRRGTGGYYVNGIIARFPRAGVSLRDAETYTRAGATATPALTSDLAIKNILFVETPTLFEAQVAGSTTIQNTFDAAGNALVQNNTATTASLFTAFAASPSLTTTAADLDWSLAAASPARTGGLATFTDKLATATSTPLASGSGTVTGTSFLGAADPNGAKWWAGWTVYVQK